jgi:serine/threonine protein kinase
MEELESFIKTKTQIFEISRGAYVQAVNLAAQNREIGKLSAKDAATIAREGKEDSLIHPGSGANREVPVMFVSQARLGGGSFGEVDIVQEISTGVVYARKHIHFGHRDGTTVSRETVKNEVVAMQSLHHRHIASVLFYIVDEEGCSIFMLPVAEQNLREYLEGCVQSRFEAGRTKPITGWFGCLLDALAFAHAEGIYHRDIKPSNILIKGTKPYLTDFGLAKVVGPDDSSTSSGIDVHGTMAYRAPEVRPGFVRHNGKPDVFSLGCTFSEMVTVTEKLSLADYIKMRNGRAFRECLSDVEKWLCDMKQNRNSRLIEMIVDETLDMMSADADKRPAASQSVNSLKRDRAFWCVEENPRHP